VYATIKTVGVDKDALRGDFDLEDSRHQGTKTRGRTKRFFVRLRVLVALWQGRSVTNRPTIKLNTQKHRAFLFELGPAIIATRMGCAGSNQQQSRENEIA